MNDESKTTDRPAVRSRFLAGPVGRLDTRWHGPPDGAPVLVLHPHPLFGGTMGSRLVHDVAIQLAAQGFLAVRFDFRGVNRSEGTYGNGLGESEDAAAVAAVVERKTGRAPIFVGYSFGGAVACRLAAQRPTPRLILVATPARVTDSALHPLEDAPDVAAPTHLVVGDADDLVPLPDARALAAAFRPPASLDVLQGAGHFLEPSRNAEVASIVLRLVGHKLP